VYYYITNNSWDNYQQYRETVPPECAYSDEVTGDPGWITDRALVVPDHDTVVGYVWGTCIVLDKTVGTDSREKLPDQIPSLYPLPADQHVFLDFRQEGFTGSIRITELSGRTVQRDHYAGPDARIRIDISAVPAGIYVLQLQSKDFFFSRKLIIHR
jgi:hypothetical protein